MRKKEEDSEPRSKRRYSERECANNACELEKKFVPHDRRQIFCCPQCRVNFYNDQRHIRNNSSLVKEKLLRLYDKKLGLIYARCVNKTGLCSVWKGILEYEQIDLRLLVEEQMNEGTKGTVRWLYRYGTELHPNSKEHFIIHKKTSK